VSRCVSTELTYKIKSECGTHSADKKEQKLNLALNPPFCNAMLLKVLNRMSPFAIKNVIINKLQNI